MNKGVEGEGAQYRLWSVVIFLGVRSESALPDNSVD